MSEPTPDDAAAAARRAHLESLPSRSMALDGTVFHCGVALVPVSQHTKWSGILQLDTQKLKCPACDAEVRVDTRTPVGPPQRVEEWRDRALAKARRIVEAGDGNLGKTFLTGGQVPPPLADRIAEHRSQS